MPVRTRRTLEQAQTAILDAAEHIVREVGPAGLRIAAVAEEAGMAHPNVIHHFGSREGLLEALTTRTLQRATDRVVDAMPDPIPTDEEEQVKALTRVLDALDEGGQGRLLAWLVISRRAVDFERPDMEPLIRLTHKWRTARFGAFDLEDTRRHVLLAAMVLVGDAVSGEPLVEAFKFGRGDRGRRRFRAWFARCLIERPPPK